MYHWILSPETFTIAVTTCGAKIFESWSRKEWRRPRCGHSVTALRSCCWFPLAACARNMQRFGLLGEFVVESLRLIEQVIKTQVFFRVSMIVSVWWLPWIENVLGLNPNQPGFDIAKNLLKTLFYCACSRWSLVPGSDHPCGLKLQPISERSGTHVVFL